jgi:hypothetical protein
LTITYPDGSSEDFAVSKDFERDGNCIYNGHLSNDLDAKVTLAGGCSFENTFEVDLNNLFIFGRLKNCKL